MEGHFRSDHAGLRTRCMMVYRTVRCISLAIALSEWPRKAAVQVWTLDLASSLWLDLVQTGRNGARLALSCLPPPDGAPYPSMPRWWHDPHLWSSTAPIYAKTSDHARSFRFREEPCPNVGSFGIPAAATTAPWDGAISRKRHWTSRSLGRPF